MWSSGNQPRYRHFEKDFCNCIHFSVLKRHQTIASALAESICHQCSVFIICQAFSRFWLPFVFREKWGYKCASPCIRTDDIPTGKDSAGGVPSSEKFKSAVFVWKRWIMKNPPGSAWVWGFSGRIHDSKGIGRTAWKNGPAMDVYCWASVSAWPGDAFSLRSL